jgi:LacI family transcriptional regulator
MVSMEELARTLGISRTTVSLVLAGKSEKYRIAEDTRKRVLSKAREMGYRRNRLAIGLKTGRTGTIGVVLPSLEVGFYNQALVGVEDFFGTEEIVLIGTSHFEAAREAEAVSAFLEQRVDGLVLVYSGEEGNQSLLREVLDREVPLVLLDRYCSQVPTNIVSTDARALGTEAAKWLRRYASEKATFAYVRPGEGQVRGAVRRKYTSDQTRESFLEELANSGIQGRFVDKIGQTASDNVEFGRAAVKKLLDEASPPFAVYAKNDSLVKGLILGARECDLSMPEDLLLCHVDPIDPENIFALPCIRLVQDMRKMGSMAAKILESEIAGDKPLDEPCRHFLKPRAQVAPALERWASQRA